MSSHVSVRLTPKQLRLVLEALESHVFWNLSDDVYRDTDLIHGRVRADVQRARQEEIRRAEKVIAKLEGAAGALTGELDPDAASQQHH